MGAAKRGHVVTGLAILMLATVGFAPVAPAAGDTITEGEGWTSIAFTWRANEPLSVTLTAFDLPNWTAPWQMRGVFFNEAGYRASVHAGAYRTSDGGWVGLTGVGVKVYDERSGSMSVRSSGDYPDRLSVTATWDARPHDADERLQGLLWVAGPVAARAWEVHGASGGTVVNVTHGTDVFVHDTPDFDVASAPQVAALADATDAVQGPDERERSLVVDAPAEMFYAFDDWSSDTWCVAAHEIPSTCTRLVPVSRNGPLPDRDGNSVTNEDGEQVSSRDGRAPAGTYTFRDRSSRLAPYQCFGENTCAGQQYRSFDFAYAAGAFATLATFE